MAHQPIPKNCILPIPLKYEELGEDVIRNSFLLEKGNLYSLQGEECEGFTMPIRVYQCKGVCKEIKGIPIDAVVMKLVEGVEDTIFSLTRQDCRFLDIDYEPQLQLFPSEFAWKRVNRIGEQENRAFTKDNMATYPPSPKYGTIRQMHVFVKDVFALDGNNGTEVIKLFGKKLVDAETFTKILYVRFKDADLQRRYPILWKFICPNPNVNTFFGKMNGSEGINLMLFFANGTEQGIEPQRIEGVPIDDLIEIGVFVQNTPRRSSYENFDYGVFAKNSLWHSTYISNTQTFFKK